MAKEENITIRCSQETKQLFNIIAKENTQFSKGDLFEMMLKSYITLQQINKSSLNEIQHYVKVNYEYLCLLMQCCNSLPADNNKILEMINKKPNYDEYIMSKVNSR